MKRYIQLILRGKLYLFEIDDELDEVLRNFLKDKYVFNDENILILDEENQELMYQIKQIVLKYIADSLNTFDINSDVKKNIDTFLEVYNPNKTTIYQSDISLLENNLSELANIYSNVITNPNHYSKQMVGDEKEQVQFISQQVEPVDDIKQVESDFKEILNDISQDRELSSEVPTEKIKEAISNIIVCSTAEEYEEKTGEAASSFDVEVAGKKASSEKVFVPPALVVIEVVASIIKENVSEDTFLKVADFIQTKGNYKTNVVKAFDNLRSKIKISGLTSRNVNYFGDQFIDQFMQICTESGTNFEDMFADYFNGYSSQKKYNSALDTFIRQFIKFNGGDENTRAMLEALIVKKAISKKLISTKYNRYLRDDFRNLEVSGNGYVRFDDRSFEMFSRASTGGAYGRDAIGISGSQMFGLNQNRTASLNENTELFGDTSESYVLPTGGVAAGKTPYKKGEVHKASKKDGDIKQPNIDGEYNPDGTKKENDGKTPDELSVKGVMGNHRLKKLFGGIGVVTTPTGVLGAAPYAFGKRFKHPTLGGSPVLDSEDSEVESLNNTLGDSDSPTDSSVDKSDNEKPEETNDDNDLNTTQGGAPVNGNTPDGENKKKNDLWTLILAFVKKHPWIIIVLGLVLVIALIIFASGQGYQNNLGYFDSVYNYNEANITLIDCENGDAIEYLSLADYVVKMTYAYSKEKDYSSETLKAFMILLKTNALSYGNYSSTDKDLSVRVCDVYLDYNNKPSGADDDWMFVGFEEKQAELNELYNTISEYLYVSTSYNSGITSLGQQNIIPITSSTLDEFEEKAKENKDFDSILSEVFASNGDGDISISRETIYVGDSRTQGMLINGIIDDEHTVYGTGYGYNWFIGNGSFDTSKTNAVSGAISETNKKIANGSYNIVLWLGVNDLGSGPDRYFEKYKELAQGEWSNHHLYVVSVGPVLDSSAQNVKNAGINEFNTKMSSLITSSGISNLTFINLNYTEESIKNYDGAGLHYGKSDYQNIHTVINNNVGSSISSSLKLYRLSDYVTYYNLTDNDAFWWPVGSDNPTRGNIYGGEPTLKTITSKFGYRDIKVEGASKNHKGMDIAGEGACGKVIIASKDGTVTKVTDNGGKRGTYVIIDHGDGIQTLYQHMQKGSYVVKVGDTVAQGQKIGLVGATGVGSGCHLHFEVWVNGIPVNPKDYISVENARMTSTYNVNISGTSGDYKNMLCSSLLSSGFSKEATVGIMANIYHESGYNPMNLQNSYETKLGYTDSSYTLAVDAGSYKKFSSDSAGYGMAQWTSSGRKAKLYDYMKSKNYSIGNFNGQFEFMLSELENSYPKVYKYIKENHTALDIGAYWCDHYESPGGSEPCSKHGNCPSAHCVNRTKGDINSTNLTTYVNNGCRG